MVPREAEASLLTYDVHFCLKYLHLITCDSKCIFLRPLLHSTLCSAEPMNTPDNQLLDIISHTTLLSIWFFNFLWQLSFARMIFPSISSWETGQKECQHIVVLDSSPAHWYSQTLWRLFSLVEETKKGNPEGTSKDTSGQVLTLPITHIPWFDCYITFLLSN